MPIYLNVLARADGFWLSHIAEEAAALSLRSQVASYMEANWDEFPTVLPEERAARLKGVRGRAWAGEEELLALSKVRKYAFLRTREHAPETDLYQYSRVPPPPCF